MICQNPKVTIFSFQRIKGTWNLLNNFVATMGLSLHSRRHRSQDWETNGDWRLPCVQLKVFGERLGRDTRVRKAFNSILITVLSVFDRPMRNLQCQKITYVQLPIFTTWPRRISPPPLLSCGLHKIAWSNRADWLHPPFLHFSNKLCLSSWMWECRLLKLVLAWFGKQWYQWFGNQLEILSDTLAYCAKLTFQ